MDTEKAIDACRTICAVTRTLESCLSDSKYIPKAIEKLKESLQELEQALKK